MNEYLQIFNSLSRRERNEQREELVAKYAWAVPTPEAINYLVSISPIIEIGAGTGYWAHLVRQAGGVVRAFDEQPYNNTYCSHQWTEVEVGNPDTVAEYPDHTLFLCWPPGYDPMAYESLMNYSGNRVIYVGDADGATACGRFRKLLKRDWELERRIEIPRFPGMFDSLASYRRK